MIKLIQPPAYFDERTKRCAIIEINGQRFFSVTPGSPEEAKAILDSIEKALSA